MTTVGTSSRSITASLENLSRLPENTSPPSPRKSYERDASNICDPFMPHVNAMNEENSAQQLRCLIEMCREILFNQAEIKSKLESLNRTRVMAHPLQCGSNDGEMANLFPIETLDKLDRLGSDLADVAYSSRVTQFLQSQGGRDPTKSIRRMFHATLVDEVAKEYSFCGQRQKKKFSNHRLWRNILDATKKRFPAMTVKEAEDAAKDWLKEATKRIKRVAEKHSTTCTTSSNATARGQHHVGVENSEANGACHT